MVNSFYAGLIHAGPAAARGCQPELREKGRCRVNVVGRWVMLDSTGLFRAV